MSMTGKCRGVMLGLLGLLAVGCAAPKPTEALAPEPARASGYPQPYHLLPLFTLNNTRLKETAALLEKTGNRAEKREASQRLVQLAETIAQDAWRESQRPIVKRMNAQGSGLNRSHEDRWLDEWQKRHMVRIYEAMKVLGGKMVLAHCRDVATDTDRRRAQQQLALGVLAAHKMTKRVAAKSAWGMPPTQAPDPLGPPPASTFGSTVGGDVAAPKRSAEAPRVEGGTIVNVDEVVDALRPYLLVCYRRALQEHGRFGAWIIMNARVSGDGSVAEVQSKGDESTPMSMMNCLKGVVKQARFAPPQGDPTVFIPLSFVAQADWNRQPAAPRAPAPAPAVPAPAVPAPAAPAPTSQAPKHSSASPA